MALKVTFKIPIATNVPLPFICRFIKKEENKKEILKTFEKEEINKPFMDAIKQVPRYDFFQGNESVSIRDSWLAMPQKEFLLEIKEVKRYHSDFSSYFSIDTSNFGRQKFFMFQDKREESVEMSEKEEYVGDKCGDNKILTSLLAKVVHYVHPSLFKPPWG